MYEFRDKWFRIISILIPSIILIYGSPLFPDPEIREAAHVLVTIIAIVIICEGSRMIVYKGRRLFSRYRGGLFVFLSGVILTALVLAITFVARKYIISGDWNRAVTVDTHIYVNGKKLGIGLLGSSLMYAFFIFPFLFGTYEFFYHAANMRLTKKTSEKLEKEKLKAELQQLKGIVNPHFLFNNLNSLSSLMAEDVQQAQEFLDELTKVFRYLLRNNETELTTLELELQFIQSYYNLLQTRYGGGINMTTKIDCNHKNLLIPPLTLQLLVENAVKHNQVSKSSPLSIEIVSESNNKLVVKNNIQAKKVLIESTGIGLQSIKTRYRMLNEPGIEVLKDNMSFAIVIPLIDPEKILLS